MEECRCNICGSEDVYELHTQYYKMNEDWEELKHSVPEPAQDVPGNSLFICNGCDGDNVKPVQVPEIGASV